MPAIAPRGASAIAITNASPLVIAIFRIIVSSILSPLMDSVTSRIWLDRERSPRADTAGIGPAEESVTCATPPRSATAAARRSSLCALQRGDLGDRRHVLLLALGRDICCEFCRAL